MLLGITLLLTLSIFATATGAGNTRSRHRHLRSNNNSNINEPYSCDESFPVVSSSSLHQLSSRQRHLLKGGGGRQRLLVTISNDETGPQSSYAPLCEDGEHIDIRKLLTCSGSTCFSEYYQVRDLEKTTLHLFIRYDFHSSTLNIDSENFTILFIYIFCSHAP